MVVASHATRLWARSRYVQSDGDTINSTATRIRTKLLSTTFCVHSLVEQQLSATEVHTRQLKHVFQVIHENKLYSNLKKCVFCAPDIPVIGCYVSKKVSVVTPRKCPRYAPDLGPVTKFNYGNDSAWLIINFAEEWCSLVMEGRTSTRIWLREKELVWGISINPAWFLQVISRCLQCE